MENTNLNARMMKSNMKYRVEAKVSFEIEVEEGYKLMDELSTGNVQYNLSNGLKDMCYLCFSKLSKDDLDFSYTGNIRVEDIKVSSSDE